MKCVLYWINLARSEDRAERMRQRFDVHSDKINCDAIVRIEATDAASAPALVDRESARSHWTDTQLRTGAVGCTLSHLRAIKQAYANDCDWAVVFEDDATLDFCDKWPTGVTMRDFVTSGAAQGGEILLLSWCLANRRNCEAVVDANANKKLWIAPFRYHLYGSFAYAVSRKAMKSVLDQRYTESEQTWNLLGRGTMPISADALLLQQKNILMSTIPLVAYEGLDSIVHPQHLSLHRRNLVFLQKCVLDGETSYYGAQKDLAHSEQL